jgi:CRISPR type III-A-associated RAMP protein Csm4
MNPGLVVKLRPTGPWRIGPDSGARNRVDVIYHSDSLYSAVTAAMSRLGWLEEWLAATARTEAPAVSFSSCFPYVGEMAFIVPPRTVWPPAPQSTKAGRVRWKSARFVPLTVVQSILAGKRLDENHWTVDGPSDCLVPAGKPGPFRTAVRSSAGVDRLTGASERHSTACIEFRPGSGLWTVVSFQDEAAHGTWSERVKAAFRLLADSGFGGERSRGWGRSEAPEFTEGMLPDLILPIPAEKAGASLGPVETAQAAVIAPAPVVPLVVEKEAEPAPQEEAPETPAVTPVEPAVEPEQPIVAAAAAAVETPILEPEATEPETPVVETSEGQDAAPVAEAADPEPEEPAVEPPAVETSPEPEPETPSAVVERPAVETPVTEMPVAEIEPADEPQEAPVEAPVVVSTTPTHPHWLLSLFTPAASDSVDWRRGNYTVLPRGGRVDSPAGSGELKKQIQMVAEGSVVYAETAPRGSAADVAPDGFAHPVFRAGFAVAIPLPEVR